MLRALAFALLLFSLCHAATAPPRIYEQRNLGDPMFEDLLYTISVDCTAATIRLIVLDSDYQRVEGAGTYLKYVDFSSPLLSNVATDKDGFALHRLPGQPTLMRGLFILVIEKKGFRNNEIHFDISPCYTDYTVPEPPAEQAPPARDAEEARNGIPDVPPAGNITAPDGPEEPAADGGDGPAPCLAVFALLATLFKAVNT